MNKSFSMCFIVFLFILQQLSAQDLNSTKKVLRLIADDIIKSTKFEFIEEKTDQTYKTTESIPSNAVLKFQSPYNDWRYWNGVLNIALLKLGAEFNESSYTHFVKSNVAFAFENYKYFQAMYNDEGKWVYPFGQLFIIEELDDCGAMGASLKEIYKTDQQKR